MTAGRNMIRCKRLLGVLMIGAACHPAYAAIKVGATGAAREELPLPCPANAQKCCEKANSKTDPEAFAKVLLCIAEELCRCPPATLAKPDRDALLEHITDTLAKLGSLEKAADRDPVQKVLGDALVNGGDKKSKVAREVLALIASMPSKQNEKVTIITEIDKIGEPCSSTGKCKTIETTVASAEPVAPVPLSTAVIEIIEKKISKLRVCCKKHKCPLVGCSATASCEPRAVDPCQSVTCFDSRWDLVNMLIMNAEQQPNPDSRIAELDSLLLDKLLNVEQTLGLIQQWVTGTDNPPDTVERIVKELREIASKLKRKKQNEMAATVSRIADNFPALATEAKSAKVLMDELCNYDELDKSPCGVRILLRVIDGVGEIHSPFVPPVVIGHWR